MLLWIFLGVFVLMVLPSIIIACASMNSSRMSRARRDLGLEEDEG